MTNTPATVHGEARPISTANTPTASTQSAELITSCQKTVRRDGASMPNPPIFKGFRHQSPHSRYASNARAKKPAKPRVEGIHAGMCRSAGHGGG